MGNVFTDLDFKELWLGSISQKKHAPGSSDDLRRQEPTVLNNQAGLHLQLHQSRSTPECYRSYERSSPRLPSQSPTRWGSSERDESRLDEKECCCR